MGEYRRLFGRNLKRLRKSKGLTQDNLSEISGLSLSYISQVERGVANPKLETIVVLAKAVQVQPLELFRTSSRNVTPEKARAILIDVLQGTKDSSISDLYDTLTNALSSLDESPF